MTGVTMTGSKGPLWDLIPGPMSGSGPRGGARACTLARHPLDASTRVDDNSPGVPVSRSDSFPGSDPTDPTLSLLILIQLGMCVECGW